MTDHKRMTLVDLGLFTGVPQHEHFCRMKDLLDTREMAPSAHPHLWPRGEAAPLPESFDYDGTTRVTKEFLAGRAAGRRSRSEADGTPPSAPHASRPTMRGSRTGRLRPHRAHSHKDGHPDVVVRGAR